MILISKSLFDDDDQRPAQGTAFSSSPLLSRSPLSFFFREFSDRAEHGSPLPRLYIPYTPIASC